MHWPLGKGEVAAFGTQMLEFAKEVRSLSVTDRAPGRGGVGGQYGWIGGKTERGYLAVHFARAMVYIATRGNSYSDDQGRIHVMFVGGL